MGQKLVSPATYWRRRVIVLAVGVAVLGLPIWAVNEALGGGQAPRYGSPGSNASDVAGPGARSPAERGHSQALTGETADRTSRPRVRPQPSALPGGASTASPHQPGQQACARGAVVLTLHSIRSRYGPGEPVTFVVGAVSARNRPCRLNLGATFTSVLVASGSTSVWDSSSCIRRTASRVIMLRRGEPAFLRVTWDRRASLSGCPGQGTAVRAGTYTAAAFNGQLRSRTTTFVLSGRGAAAP
jgi:hypothetical protein